MLVSLVLKSKLFHNLLVVGGVMVAYLQLLLCLLLLNRFLDLLHLVVSLLVLLLDFHISLLALLLVKCIVPHQRLIANELLLELLVHLKNMLLLLHPHRSNPLFLLVCRLSSIEVLLQDVFGPVEHG